MNDASRLLDGDLTAAELTTLLDRLKHDAVLPWVVRGWSTDVVLFCVRFISVALVISCAV